MELPPEQGLATQRTKGEQPSLDQSREIARQRWQRHIKFKSPQQAAKEEQQKRNFWPLLGGVVVGSLVAAFVLSNVFCAGEDKAFYAIWFILTIIGYCLLVNEE